MKKAISVLNVSILFLLTLTFFHSSVVMAASSGWVKLSLSSDFGLRGSSINVTLTSSYKFANVSILNPYGNLIYEKTWSANDTKTLPISSTAPYGTYTIKASVDGVENTVWFTVLDISDWTPTVFPYKRQHKGVNYTFYSDGKFTAESKTGNLTLNFGLLREIIKKYDLTVAAYYNSMNFRVKISKSGSDVNINLVWSFIWKGCKFTIEGTIDKPRQFSINITKWYGQFKNFGCRIRSGKLIFDWSDLKRTKYVFSYDKENKVVKVDIPKSFSLDPYIYESGFETGDLSEWDGSYTSSGTLNVESGIVHSGTYALNATAQANGLARVYKGFTANNVIYVDGWFRFDNIIQTDWRKTEFITVRDSSSGTTVFGVQIYHTTPYWRIEYRNDSDFLYATVSTDPPTADEWREIQVKVDCSSADGTFDASYEVWVDGTSVWSASGYDSDVTSVNEIRVGVCENNEAVTNTIWVDDIIVDDSYISGGANSAPTIGEFQASSTVYANQWFYLNASVNDADGISEIINATIELSNNVILKWDNASATFSEQSDTNNYCTLNASACIETEKNSTAFKLSWKLKLNNYPSGSVNILSSNTKVWDSTESGNNSKTGLFTFSYITLNLQARDSSGTNLPRSVAFSGTLGNGTSFTKTSNTNGLATLTTCYGPHTVQVKWGTHLVKSSTSFSVTSNKTQNFDTTIARLNSGSYYVLISINQTTPATPEVNGLPNWKMYGISGSGQKDLKVDVANWVDTSQPSIIKVMGNPYETGWNWDGTNKILSGFTLDFDANPSLNLEMEWGTSSGGPGGSSGGSDTVPVTPEEEPEKPQDTINPPVYIIPEYQQPVIPTDTVTTIIVGSCIVICIGLVINWLFEQNSTSKLWNRKSKKPKWKK